MVQPLARLWQGWKRIARRIGEFQTHVLLTLLYFLLVAPMALIVQPRDLLALRQHPGWRPFHGRASSFQAARRQ